MRRFRCFPAMPMVRWIPGILTASIVAACSAGTGETPTTAANALLAARATIVQWSPAPGSKGCPCLYAGSGANSILVFDRPLERRHANIAPDRTIAGESTGLSGPLDIALDGQGNLYALNAHQSVTEYR